MHPQLSLAPRLVQRLDYLSLLIGKRVFLIAETSAAISDTEAIADGLSCVRR